MLIGPPILRYSNFKIWRWKSLVKVMCVVKGQGNVWPWKFKGQGHGQGQTHWSHLRPGVQSICLLFFSWQSDECVVIYVVLERNLLAMLRIFGCDLVEYGRVVERHVHLLGTTVLQVTLEFKRQQTRCLPLTTHVGVATILIVTP